ncbi:TDP-N-acetylfucosamine:lipid II N-acetylfucosaminyltransferase [Mannheimia sp. AT1]|uniref:TDP-N-acetylfucosamine:lipid II N-acetylfucosaminyltransferase n=1 Tax=Mannheimia cairinae TaxID=3025936 RepID=A0ABT5MS18_9PAST|nr:TDP-N-acetylfucosamine:lipid II N-acetylfucosaminyltransferase [Mannheimia cairinae]MDD0824967.1 TDP-N-acetylfucosamine:lipid II N-acetylfucosaminyltransferase [Mannheimia cairinae]MDD0827205.1 TDP-N-acetylfucosamine:lipid II N-acetylfucosaminyltransferase [Mannheimia cairinae]
MTDIYHILGADIPHHNRRLLEFFRQDLLPDLMNQEHFFYVVGNNSVIQHSSDINISLFSSSLRLAKAIIKQARKNPNAYFILHGQFNFWIWLAILLNQLPTKQLVWHIWGADLYETSNLWKFKLFYPIRRLAQKKIRKIWATSGDLAYFWQKVRERSKEDRILYFPTLLPKKSPDVNKKRDRIFTILLGNSGDSSNNHIEALNQIQQQLGNNVRIIIPMGYPANNEKYILQVEQHCKRLFSANNLQILKEKLDFEEYTTLLKQCDLGYFNFERQQGIGTISLLVEYNIPCVLHPNNPFCLDMQQEKVPFLQPDTITKSNIQLIKQELEAMDKEQIAFFYPAYTVLWQARLNELVTQ